MKTLDKETIEYLSNDSQEKLIGVIQKAKTFMRVSKRKKLSSSDLKHALQTVNDSQVNDWDLYINDNKDRDKDDIIDIDDYLRAPMAQKSMKQFGHFHWLIIEGNKPNISENYINSNTVIYPSMDIDRDTNQLILMNELNLKNNNTVNNANKRASNVIVNQKDNSINNYKVIPKLRHNISKEIAIFREEFEIIFNQEIKRNLLLKDTVISLMKETEINLVVLQSEPGVVNLLPLILDILINTVVNDHFKNEPKVHIIALIHIKAIIHNQFFFLIPYLSQTISLLLSMILSEGNNIASILIQVKNMAIEILKYLLDKYSNTYPIMINNLIDIFKEHIVPDMKFPMFLTSYGAIKSITILSEKHIKDIIYPRIDEIMKSFTISIHISNHHKDIQEREREKEAKIEETNHSASLPPSLPKYSFSLSLTALADPFISSSIFAFGPSLSQAVSPGINQSIQNNNAKSFEKETIIEHDSIRNINNNKTSSSTDDSSIDNKWEIINHKSTYVYYALVEAVKILYNAYYEDKELVNYLNDIFGEVLLNYRKDNAELHLLL